MGATSSHRPRRIVDLGTRSTLVAAVLAAGIAGLGAVARQQGVPRYRTIWAEDGGLFAQCPMLEPSPITCLVKPYDGWLHLVPRLLGWAAASVPPHLLSYALTGLAALALAGCAFLVARAVAGASGFAIAGLVAGAGVGLVYPAGAEVAGDITNLPWVMFAASAVILTCSTLGRSMDGLDATFIVLTIASTPFGLLLGVLVALDWIIHRRRSIRLRYLAIGAGLTAVQLAAATVSPRNAIPDVPVTLASPVAWLWEYVLVGGPFGGRGVVPGWVIGLGTIGILGAAAWLAVRSAADDQSRAASVRPDWRAVCAIVGLGGVASAEFAVATYLNHHVAPRYVYVPAVVLVVVLLLGVAQVVRSWNGSVTIGGRRARRSTLAVAFVGLIVAAGFATTFRVRTGASDGPSYPAAYEAAIPACTQGGTFAVVPISPRPTASAVASWQIRIPCDRVIAEAAR